MAEVFPRIAWDSVLEDASLSSAASTESDGPLEHVTSWARHTFWRPTGVGPFQIEATLAGLSTVNAWAIAGHDAEGTISMETWNGSSWDAHSSVVADGSSSMRYLVGDAVETTKLRFTFPDLTHLAVLWAGQDVILPEGVTPGWSDPTIAQRAEVFPEVSRDGIWLGTAIHRFKARLAMSLRNVDAAWVLANWVPFLRQCSAQPFFLHWHRTDWPDSAAFCSAAEFGQSPFSNHDMIDVSVSFDAEVGGISDPAAGSAGSAS